MLMAGDYDWVALTSPEAASVFLEGWAAAGKPEVGVTHYFTHEEVKAHVLPLLLQTHTHTADSMGTILCRFALP